MRSSSVEGALAVSLAGCLGDSSGEAGQSTATASFFVLSDFAEQIVGDGLTIENLVPVGQHGHGWEPGPNVQRSVLQSLAFLYVGHGFQPWADNIVSNLAADAPEVVVVEAWEDIDLLAATGHDQGEEDGGHKEDEDHDETGVDPHFWLNPQRAAQAVETIAAGLGAADADRAQQYRDGAAAYTEVLSDLDTEFENALSTRTREAVLVAGHDAFQYLATRYGFEVHALSSLSPDDEPTPQDVRHAQEIIEEHDIEYVLAPVFESDRAARQLVEETDATGLLPITSIPSISEEWRDKGWSYEDIMREVNLASLTEALGA
ncbi:metal ABC transporter substrate-binding protein [Haladaptatus sp. GCM10025707]|uniref:metal ABC transporter substrate-binding protein n=1 Tax=Haladaptatus sp. GCM10025707 TaxID=3252658 RepID=UPI00360795C0